MTHKIDGNPVARAAEARVAPTAARSGSERGEPVAAAASTGGVRLTGEAEILQTLGRELGAAPAGVDLDRVNALRAAIAGGDYRVDAQAIAARMLELDRQLAG